MFGIGAQELAVILVIALLVFGPKRLPELARSMGKGLAEFRRASNDLREAVSADPDAPAPKPEGPAQAGADAPKLPQTTVDSGADEDAGTQQVATSASEGATEAKEAVDPSSSRG